MRVYYIVLLAATLSATINAEVTHSSPRLLSERQSHLTTGHLRSLKSTNTNQEERISFAGFELKVGVIDNMLERAKMSPTFKAMVDKRASAADALKAFTVRKTADDVLDTPAWKEWAQYVIYRAVKNNDAPDEALGAAMSVAYTPAGLSSLVAKSMANPNTKTIAKALEQSQINRWLDGNYKPSAIFKTLSLEKTDDIF
ncbi:RxLR effector protein, partial [Phytophthora megakarya]